MSILAWDNIGEREYQTGVDKGVLYPTDSNGKYMAGVAWNGLTAVNESPSGAEPTSLYANNHKYLTLVSAEEYGLGIEAYMYPDEFAECDGSASIGDGVTIGQQPRKAFGFSYQTRKGNDTQGTSFGYKIHLVYGCLAAPSEQNNETINEDPDAITFSWEVATTPVNVAGYSPTSTIVIDSTKINKDVLAELESIIYGSSSEDARLPLPDEIIAIVNGSTVDESTYTSSDVEEDNGIV